MTTYAAGILGATAPRFPEPASYIKAKDQTVLKSDLESLNILNNSSTQIAYVDFPGIFAHMNSTSSANPAHKAYTALLIAHIILQGTRTFFTLAGANQTYSINERAVIIAFLNRYTKMSVSPASYQSNRNRGYNFVDMTRAFIEGFNHIVNKYPNMSVRDVNSLLTTMKQNVTLYRLQDPK